MNNLWKKILLLLALLILVFLFARGAGLQTSVLHSLENVDDQEFDSEWLNQYEVNPNSINKFTLENPGDIVGKDIIIIEE